MGLFGNIFKPLQGKLTAKQEENMKKVAEVFKEKTGKDYQTAVVWKMTNLLKSQAPIERKFAGGKRA